VNSSLGSAEYMSCKPHSCGFYRKRSSDVDEFIEPSLKGRTVCMINIVMIEVVISADFEIKN
jgi:hypothetical protein